MEYEPWLLYEQARRRRGGASRSQPAPYQELLQLGSQLESIEYEHNEVLPRRMEKVVLSGCRRNALLGLLPHIVLMAASPDGKKTADGNDLWSWTESRGGAGFVGHTGIPRTVAQRAKASRTNRPPRFARRPLMEVLPDDGGVLIRPIHQHKHLFQPYDTEWARYFPTGSSLAAPQVGSLNMEEEGFWREYGEPVYDFLRGVLLMYWSFLSWTQPEDMKAREGGAYPTTLESAYWELNQLASVASLAGFPRDSGAPGVRWASPSLVGHYAIMMLSDLAGGNQVRICDRCGAPFLSAAYKAYYCSPRCKSAARKRRQRAGQRRSTGE